MEENPKTIRRRRRRRRRMVGTLRDLPEDIIINILSRLPVKSLLRFRCVCKSWHSLFSDPKFINTHLSQTRANNNGCVLVKSTIDINRVSLHCNETFVKHMELEPPLKRPFKGFKVEGYCNGLLCLFCPGTLHDIERIYLWNPAIRKLKALPETLQLRDIVPAAKPHKTFVAFGFAPQINDYKVLKFMYYSHKHDGFRLEYGFEVEIYSLRRKIWKRVQNFVPYVFFNFPMTSTLNGVIYWTVLGMQRKEPCNKDIILAFDMAIEVFNEIEIPECYGDNFEDTVIMALMDSLSLCVFYRETKNLQRDISVMRGYGAVESWTKLFTFDQCRNIWNPLGFMKNGEVVMQFYDGELFLYDPRLQQVRDLCIPGVPRGPDVFTYYMESLVLLDDGN